MPTICGMNSTTKVWPRSLSPVSRMLKLMCSSISKPSHYTLYIYICTAINKNSLIINILRYSELSGRFLLQSSDNWVSILISVWSAPVTERAMRTHWKNVGGYQVYSTWWSPASCSSTSPASGLTSSKPLLSRGLFPTTTSCVRMEVRINK